MIEFSKKYISETLTQKLFNLIPEIIKLYRDYKVFKIL